MLTNQQQNLKSSLYNAIYKWRSDNADEIQEAFMSPFGDMITELMTESAFYIIIAQHNINSYYKDKETNF